jgi:anti-sigma factor RsiW
MNCDDAKNLLELHADGELDLVRQVEVEAHAASCPACADRLRGLAARKAALSGRLTRHRAPEALRNQVRLAAGIGAPVPIRGAHGWLNTYGGMAALLALAVLAGYRWGGMERRNRALLGEAVADHVRSLQAGHLTDVVSTDQHTVKPWFMGKIDFSPPVADLADHGFPLAGGRLDRIDGEEAAALVFRRRLHAVNLFVWRAANGTVRAEEGRQSGFSEETWTAGGLNFLAVSDIAPADLGEFVKDYRAATE